MTAARTYADWFEIEHEGKDIEVLARFTFSDFVPATYWQPAEGGEIDIIAAETIDKIDIIDRLSDEQIEEIAEQIELRSERYVDDGPDPDDARDRMIDDRLTGDA